MTIPSQRWIMRMTAPGRPSRPGSSKTAAQQGRPVYVVRLEPVQLPGPETSPYPQGRVGDGPMNQLKEEQQRSE